jgi:hypothetical protein
MHEEFLIPQEAAAAALAAAAQQQPLIYTSPSDYHKAFDSIAPTNKRPAE